MPDIVIRGIDNDMAERIKEIARLNNMPINDVILRLLKEALGMSQPEPPLPGDIARLAGAWEDDESRIFHEAMNAFKRLPDDQAY